jgi:hypothetical protein
MERVERPRVIHAMRSRRVEASVHATTIASVEREWMRRDPRIGLKE